MKLKNWLQLPSTVGGLAALTAIAAIAYYQSNLSPSPTLIEMPKVESLTVTEYCVTIIYRSATNPVMSHSRFCVTDTATRNSIAKSEILRLESEGFMVVHTSWK